MSSRTFATIFNGLDTFIPRECPAATSWMSRRKLTIDLLQRPSPTSDSQATSLMSIVQVPAATRFKASRGRWRSWMHSTGETQQSQDSTDLRNTVYSSYQHIAVQRVANVPFHNERNDPRHQTLPSPAICKW